ncbi:hypothetical protein SAMN04488021_1132 [Paracoccus aminovorans]|uniref:Uncharacterized protein n=1 Tax=Paracoccus aminovorans TaxID=34004 RepID=A0A1I3A7C5_9RHOB|nr:hypothetical protein [Paracoccus aminovorans]CQR83878.1 hypothetical protein JCM7685_pAMV1p0090 [Paracoccus aminovorans]SFH45810.1 hypothetical protein SAMN04488021_1132 [Paracoccus aminovorans]
MSRIPFLLVRTFDPAETLASLEDRFLRHLGKLRGMDSFADEAWERTEPETENAPMIRIVDRHRIRRRIRRILEARNAISGFDRLKIEDRAQLEKLHGSVRLVSIVSEAHADEIAGRCRENFPGSARPRNRSGDRCAARSATAFPLDLSRFGAAPLIA